MYEWLITFSQDGQDWSPGDFTAFALGSYIYITLVTESNS